MNIINIVSIAKQNSFAKILFHHLKSRQNNALCTKIDSVLSLVQGATRSEIVSLFKELEKQKVGHFIVGRRGHPSRFEWTHNASELAEQVLAGLTESEHPIQSESETPKSSGSLEYLEMFLGEKGINGKIVRNENVPHISLRLPLGYVWCELLLREAGDGVEAIVTLPAVPRAPGSEKVVAQINQKSLYGIFILCDQLEILYALRTKGQLNGIEDAQSFIEMIRCDVATYAIPLILAALWNPSDDANDLPLAA